MQSTSLNSLLQEALCKSQQTYSQQDYLLSKQAKNKWPTLRKPLLNPAATTAPNLDIANITEQLMQLEQAKQMSQLGARVLSTADESLGTLIDIQA